MSAATHKRRPMVHASRAVHAPGLTLCGKVHGGMGRGKLLAGDRRSVTCVRCLDAIHAEDEKHPCAECKADAGACSSCEGTGGEQAEAALHGDCENCHGDANCPECKGTGVDPDFDRFP